MITTNIFTDVTLTDKSKWLVLYSGGLDSLVVAHLLYILGKDITLLHMNYGQRAQEAEMAITKKYADFINVPLMTMKVEDTFKNILTQLHSSLAEVSRLWDDEAEGGGVDDAESSMSYVPFRNTLFLTIGGMVAEQRGINNITFGSNLSETMTYSDNSEPFIRAMDQLVKLGSNAKPLNIRAPLFTLTKTKLIELGLMIGTPFELSTSCYFPLDDESSCGKCGSCTLRINAFKRCQLIDPSAPKSVTWDDDCYHSHTRSFRADKNSPVLINWLNEHQVNLELE